jgi:fructose-bisphosphate aldolase/6-deoxy-5-ketofructose 1-phosphate synthase
VGYTIYTGSEYEAAMFNEGVHIIHDAHKHGMVAVIWGYLRGKAVKDERDPRLIAGAAGVSCCLGAAFVNVNYPKKQGVDLREAFKEVVQAAGRTKVVCTGGGVSTFDFLELLHDQIFISGAIGNATGRNIHQKSLRNAVKMRNATSAITIKGSSVAEAIEVYKGKKGA